MSMPMSVLFVQQHHANIRNNGPKSALVEIKLQKYKLNHCVKLKLFAAQHQYGHEQTLN